MPGQLIGGWTMTALAKALEPFLLQIIKSSPSSAALLLNKIILIPSGTGDPSVYPKTDAGVDSASSAATSGATIYLPPGTFTANHAWTDGVEYWGAGRDKTIFTGKITIGTAVPNNLSVNRTANDANELTAVEVTGSKSPQGFGCDFTAVQSGAGDAYGVKILGGNGTPRFENCYIDGQSTGGIGKGIFQAGIASTPSFNITWDDSVHEDEGGTSGTASWTWDPNTWSGTGIWNVPNVSFPVHRQSIVLQSNLGTGSHSYKTHARPKAQLPRNDYTTDIANAMPQHCRSTTGGFSQWGSYVDEGVDGMVRDQGSFVLVADEIIWCGYAFGQEGRWASGNPTTLEWEFWLEIDGETNLETPTTAITSLRWCRINGSTTDIDAGAGTIQVYACDYDPASIAGTVEQLQGDRGAFDVANYGTRHASDFAAGDSHHPPVTMAADADALLGLSGQALSLDSQNANTVLAGPASGAAADPTFRALVVADIPNLTVSTADVSNPPTDAELDSAFGTPATVGAGFRAVVNDNGAGTNVYLVVSDGTNWWYEELTKAV